jgi:hypothetical protein
MEEGIHARRFRAWFRHEQTRGSVFDVKFYPADVDGATPEAIFEELSAMLAQRARLAFVEKQDLF